MNVTLPLPERYMPKIILDIMEGPYWLQAAFIQDSMDVSWRAAPGVCMICHTTLDPTHPDCSPSPFFQGPAAHQDSMIVRNGVCQHVFHAGCFHFHMEHGGPNRNLCPLCRAPWFHFSNQIEDALNAQMSVVLIRANWFNSKEYLKCTRVTPIDVLDFMCSLAITAHAILEADRHRHFDDPDCLPHHQFRSLPSIAALPDGREVVGCLVRWVGQLNFEHRQPWWVRWMVINKLNQELAIGSWTLAVDDIRTFAETVLTIGLYHLLWRGDQIPEFSPRQCR